MMISRAFLRSTIVGLIMCVGFPFSLNAQRVMLDAGMAQVDWLSPDNWGPSIGIQARLLGTERVSMIGGLRGVFGLETPGIGLSRRDRLATALLGGEVRVARAGRASLYASASLAHSYYWFRYSSEAPFLDGTTASGFTWFRGVYAARLHVATGSRFGINLRADVQPRFGDLRSINPTFGLGVSY
ncbi:MAG: hypothetical protein MUF00_20510 [Gemmatimonadaceae bacterium]|jgi:hypothetical protein|nr:hypothetical protein [Gemmatimonadaceae bacterium]